MFSELRFINHEAGPLECWYRETPNGALTSFDVAQLPKKVTEVLGALVVEQQRNLALANKAVKDHAAAIAAKDEAVAARLAELDDPALVTKLEADLAAKDANIQALLAERDESVKG